MSLKRVERGGQSNAIALKNFKQNTKEETAERIMTISLEYE